MAQTFFGPYSRATSHSAANSLDHGNRTSTRGRVVREIKGRAAFLRLK